MFIKVLTFIESQKKRKKSEEDVKKFRQKANNNTNNHFALQNNDDDENDLTSKNADIKIVSYQGARKREKAMVDESDSDCVDGPINVAITSDGTSNKTRRTFSPAVKQYLVRWLLRYRENPYPSPRIKAKLAKNTNLSINQIEDFFING